MLRAMSTYVCVKERLHPGLLDGLVRGGAQAIEIFAARGHFDYSNRRSHVKEIASWFRDSGVPLHSMHSPMFNDYEWGRSGAPAVNVTEPDKKLRYQAMDEIKRAIEVAEQIPFRYLVQHMGNSGDEFSLEKFDAGVNSLEHLRAFAKPLGVTLLVENIPNELSTAERLLDFIRLPHFTDVGVCFDVGHAYLAEGVAETFEKLKEYVRSTHVHDNQHDRDSHLWPGEGKIDWKEAMALLRSAPQAPPVLMEIDGEGRSDIPKGMAEAYRRLEAA